MVDRNKWIAFCEEAVPHMDAILALIKEYNVDVMLSAKKGGYGCIRHTHPCGLDAVTFGGAWRVMENYNTVTKIKKNAPRSGNSGGAQK